MGISIYVSSWYKDLNYVGDYVGRVKRLGFDGIELSIDYPLLFKKKLEDSLRDILRSNDLELGIHLPWRDVELASPIEEIRSASVSIVLRSMDVLAKFEPKYFVTHLSTEQDYCGFRGKDCIEASIRSLEVLGDKARELAVPLLIETTYEKCCGSEEYLPFILDRLSNNPYIGVCADVAQMIGYRIRRWKVRCSFSGIINDLPPIIKDKIEVIHFHGFKELDYGITYVHLMPNDELINDLVKAVSVLRARARIVTLEIYKDVEGNDLSIEDLASIVEKLRRLLVWRK